jgi:signal transduction histidine kinase
LYWEAASISALRDPGGEITHYLAVKSDITERKWLETQIEQRNRELARSQTLAELGRMAAMLAHDLRNPLSSVKMAVQILGKRAADAEAQELGRISQEQVRYMEDIITDMLTFARPGDLRLEWLQPRKLLDGAVASVRRRIQEAGAAVEVTCTPGLPTFPGDASKLRQLLVNLLVNALQAVRSRPSGEGRVSLVADLQFAAGGTRIRFRVCDNGEGVDPSEVARLFEPFVTTRTKGTGLGLAIVRQIAESHGGAVSLLPSPSGGACAEVLLPVVPADHEDTPGLEEPLAQPSPARGAP